MTRIRLILFPAVIVGVDLVPTWQAFASFAGPTTAIVAAAEIAALVVPPPALP